MNSEEKVIIFSALSSISLESDHWTGVPMAVILIIYAAVYVCRILLERKETDQCK